MNKIGHELITAEGWWWQVGFTTLFFLLFYVFQNSHFIEGSVRALNNWKGCRLQITGRPPMLCPSWGPALGASGTQTHQPASSPGPYRLHWLPTLQKWPEGNLIWGQTFSCPLCLLHKPLGLSPLSSFYHGWYIRATGKLTIWGQKGLDHRENQICPPEELNSLHDLREEICKATLRRQNGFWAINGGIRRLFT